MAGNIRLTATEFGVNMPKCRVTASESAFEDGLVNQKAFKNFMQTWSEDDLISVIVLSMTLSR